MRTASNMEGKAALVSAAGDYLGRATAVKLAEIGANVCLVDSDAAGLEESESAVRALGRKAHVHLTDISQPENCAGAVAAAVDELGRLDALCNVATAFFPSRTTSMPRDHWESSLAINLSAPFYLIQAAIPHLLKTKGAIVNVTSSVVLMAVPYTAAYAATKAGLAHMTKALAREYIDQPIRINAIAPGSMPIGPGTKINFPSDLDPAEFQRSSHGRGMIEVESVADLIAFLASDASEGYHGACISIDNGISLG